MSAHLNARVLPLFVFAAVAVDPASSGEDRQGAAFPLTVVAQRLQDEPQSALLADDRSVIVTTSYGYGRIVWEGATGRMLRRLKLPTDDGRGSGSGNLTPDGSRLLNGRTLWDTVRGVQFLQFDDGYSDTAEPQLGGTVIAALKSDDRSVDIIDSATGVVQRTITAPTKVESVALSRDGGLMALEQGDNSTLVWSAATGSLKATLKGTTSYSTVPFSPSGQLIVTRQSGETDVWGLDGSLKWQLTKWVDIEFSPDSSLAVAYGEKSSAEIHDAATGDLLATLPPGAGKFVGFAGNSSVVFDAGEGNLRLQFFDVRSGKQTEEIKDEKKQIVGEGSTPGVVLTRYEDGTLELYDLLARNVIQRLGGPSSGGSAFALSRSGARVASFHQGRIEVLTAADWKLVGRCDGLASSASVIFFSDDEQTIFVPTEEGALQICSVDKSRRENSNITGAEGAVASSASGRLALGISENQLRLTDLHGVQDGITFSLGEGRANSITFSADGQRLFVGTGNNRILSWDLGKTPRERKTLRMMVGPVTAMALSHDGTRIAAGTIFSPTVKVWNVSDGKLLREMTKDLVGSRSWAMTSMQFLPTNSNIVAAGFGKSVRLWEISSGRELVDFPTEDDVRSLAFATGGRRLVAVDDAGTVHYWDVETQKLLLIRRQFGDGEWIALTPEGFFDSSPNGAKWLNAVKGMKSLAIDQVYDALYRPDLVAEKLAGDPRGLVKEAAAKLDLDKVMRSGAAPKVSIVSPQPGIEASSDSVSVEAAITALGGGIGRIEWRVNGVTLGIEGERGLARIDDKPAEGAAPVAEKSQKVSRTLSIEPGENTIEIVAYNAANLIASKPAKVTVKLAASASVRPPKLFVLAIGVNDYYDGRMHLTYAVPDAKDIAAGLAKAGEGHYESVEVTTLIDKEVTAARLGEVFVELAKTVRPKDVLLFYAAGHGKTQDGRYYYLPQDFRYQTEASIAENGIGQDKWQGWFASIPAKKSILIYDTCESGTLTSAPGQQVVAMRSGLEQAAALGRLIQATGRTVLTAATSDRPALEGYQGHGVFTYALLDGLSGADRNSNGLIEVTELAGHVDGLVPEITQKAFGIRQVPQMSIQGSDFALAKRIEAPVAARDTAAPVPASPAATGPPAPTQPTHVVIEMTKVFETPGGNGTVVEELYPFTAVVITKTENGWSIVARDGKVLGFVEESKVKRLQ